MRTRSDVAQSSGSTTRPNLFAADSDEESDDDEDAYSGGSALPTAEGPNIRDSRGKAAMTDTADPSSGGDSCSRCSAVPTSFFRDLSGDAIHRDFFLFSPGPYYATYPEGGIASSCKFRCEEWDAPHQSTLTVLTKEVFKDLAICKIVVDQLPTSREMVQIETLTNDQLTTKMSVIHCLMMSRGGELLA
ncbi:hypothetical protein Tco_1249892 [Tanacetum coccineum]